MGKNEKVGIVILNYNSIQFTRKLVEEIIKNINKELYYHIVVVDNNSDESGFESLKAYYIHKKNISFIDLETNIGYGGGNNRGIEYLIDINCDYIIISNPDILIPYYAVIDNMIEGISKDEKTAMIAPQILGPNGNKSNPIRSSYFSKKDINSYYLRYVNFFSSTFFLYYTIILRVFINFNRYLRGEKKKVKTFVYALHGSFFMIKTKFFLNNDLLPLFDENIFLFNEENILAEKIHKKGGVNRLLEDFYVYHLEDKSFGTTSMIKSIKKILLSFKSNKYFYKNYLK